MNLTEEEHKKSCDYCKNTKIDLNEHKLNLTLQLVMKIAKEIIPHKDLKNLCDDYGLWEDDKEFISGEYRKK